MENKIDKIHMVCYADGKEEYRNCMLDDSFEKKGKQVKISRRKGNERKRKRKEKTHETKKSKLDINEYLSIAWY